MQENEGKYISLGTHSYTDYHHEMSDSRGPIEYPYTRFHPRYAKSRISEIERGIDPKEKWINYCKPTCKAQEDIWHRCEDALKILKSADAEKSCIYRFRNWVECVEGCAQPKVFYHLKGASRRGPMDWFKPAGPTGMH